MGSIASELFNRCVSLKLISYDNTNKMNKPAKFAEFGSIYYVDLRSAVDHCIAEVRPCLIIERDRMTITVFPITKDDGRPIYRSELRIPEGVGNLKKNSKLRLGQTITVDKKRVRGYIGELPSRYLLQIERYIIKRGIINNLRNVRKRRIPK